MNDTDATRYNFSGEESPTTRVLISELVPESTTDGSQTTGTIDSILISKLTNIITSGTTLSTASAPAQSMEFTPVHIGLITLAGAVLLLLLVIVLVAVCLWRHIRLAKREITSLVSEIRVLERKLEKTDQLAMTASVMTSPASKLPSYPFSDCLPAAKNDSLLRKHMLENSASLERLRRLRESRTPPASLTSMSKRISICSLSLQQQQYAQLPSQHQAGLEDVFVPEGSAKAAGLSQPLPQYTATFADKTVDIFTDITNPLQLYRFCTDYFSEQPITGSTNQDPLTLQHVGHVAAGKSIASVTADKASRVNSTDSGSESGIDMSNLTSVASSYCPQEFEQGICVRKAIGYSGGELNLHGLKLTIPEGAIMLNQEICLAVRWSANCLHSLSDGDGALLSPVVSCEPTTLSFHKPVQLRIPHCAANVKTDWTLSILKSYTDTGEDRETSFQWEALNLSDYTERLIGDSHVTISLIHLATLVVVGQPKLSEIGASKFMKQAVFMPRVRSEAGKFTARCYCANSYCKEKRGSGKRITVHNSDNRGLGIKARTSDACESIWSVEADTGVLEHRRLWKDTSSGLDFSFTRTSSFDAHAPLSCQLEFSQSTTGPDQRIVIEATNLFVHVEKPAEKIPEDLKAAISVKLDVDVQPNWRELAEQMGHSILLPFLQKRSSPTNELLHHFESDESSSVDQLRRLLLDINRSDIVAIIDRYYSIAIDI